VVEHEQRLPDGVQDIDQQLLSGRHVGCASACKRWYGIDVSHRSLFSCVGLMRTHSAGRCKGRSATRAHYRIVPMEAIAQRC
jgi:hypothetical protein